MMKLIYLNQKFKGENNYRYYDYFQSIELEKYSNAKAVRYEYQRN